VSPGFHPQSQFGRLAHFASRQPDRPRGSESEAGDFFCNEIKSFMAFMNEMPGHGIGVARSIDQTQGFEPRSVFRAAWFAKPRTPTNKKTE
jgi:hypothetical protein